MSINKNVFITYITQYYPLQQVSFNCLLMQIYWTQETKSLQEILESREWKPPARFSQVISWVLNFHDARKKIPRFSKEILQMWVQLKACCHRCYFDIRGNANICTSHFRFILWKKNYEHNISHPRYLKMHEELHQEFVRTKFFLISLIRVEHLIN